MTPSVLPSDSEFDGQMEQDGRCITIAGAHCSTRRHSFRLAAMSTVGEVWEHGCQKTEAWQTLGEQILLSIWMIKQFRVRIEGCHYPWASSQTMGRSFWANFLWARGTRVY